MRVRISQGARIFLGKQDIRTVALTFLEIEAACTVGVAKEVSVTFDPPKDPEKFQRTMVEGIEVFVDNRLTPFGDVVIKRQGFWKFSSLYADGLRVPL